MGKRSLTEVQRLGIDLVIYIFFNIGFILLLDCFNLYYKICQVG